MYIHRVKKKTTYSSSKPAVAAVLNDAVAAAAVVAPEPAPPMVRTQIYLTKREYDYLQAESARRGEPMAAIIRSFIDEKMEIPAEAWENNPLLAPPADDPDWQGHEDGAINHDHYIYGCPKKWVKRNGQWVEAPPLPDDYYSNEVSRRAYDEMIERME
jgi:hypothetical protein